MTWRRLASALLASLVFVWPAAAERYIVVASTTSTEQSGLFGHILPKFESESGIQVGVVALGTGQALDVGRRGDADVVFVHDVEAERAFVAEGHGVERREVMHNDFILVGPAADPAGIKGLRDVVAALGSVAEAGAPFASRGDESGTHKAELRLWRLAAVDVSRARAWYRETGSGMGPTLNAAAAMAAYALTDRGTWLSFKNKGPLTIVSEGDPRLFNQYGVMLVNPARHRHVKAAEGRAFIDWLVSPAGQRAIADFRIGGEPLFFPNARPGGS